MKYLLPKHIFLCFTADSPIFLDLRNDKYVGMPQTELPALRDLVESNGKAQGSSDILDALVKAGLLTLDIEQGKELACVSIQTARTTAGALTLDERPRLTVWAMVRLIAACTEAYLLLRLLKLERVIGYLLRRRSGLATASDATSAVQDCVATFRLLRPLLYTSRDKCLFDSIVLALFLLRYRIPCLVVFGVNTAPFEAHCWIQQGDRVLNGSPEFVSAFTPIMAV